MAFRALKTTYLLQQIVMNKMSFITDALFSVLTSAAKDNCV